MRRIAFTLLLLGLGCTAAAQLRIADASDKNRVVEYTVQNALPYDSLTHITAATLGALPGQTLFMHGTAGARGPQTYYADVFYTGDFRTEKAPRYKGGTTTPAEAVVGKYYEVLKVWARPGSMSGSCLLLREKVSGDLIWFNPEWFHRAMTCVGCYEKLRRLHIGRTFYGTGTYVRTDTGERRQVGKRSVWRCVDLEIEMNGDGTVLLLENEAGERVKGHPAAGGAVFEFVSEILVAEAVQQFGKEFGEQIALREVVVGMTAEMAVAAWGKPFRTSSRETEEGKVEYWSFDGGRSLTIADGKVAAVYIPAW